MKNIIARLWRTEGQDLIEYALLIILLATVAIVAVAPLGVKVAQAFTTATTAMVPTPAAAPPPTN